MKKTTLNILKTIRLGHSAEPAGTSVNASLPPWVHVAANGVGGNRRTRADSAVRKRVKNAPKNLKKNNCEKLTFVNQTHMSNTIFITD